MSSLVLYFFGGRLVYINIISMYLWLTDDDDDGGHLEGKQDEREGDR